MSINLEECGISPTQWPYYRFWFAVLMIAEGLMLLLNNDLFVIYMMIALLFFGGFLLRALKIYQGQGEPLILDFSAVIFAIGFAYAGEALRGSPWRFLLILCSSIIIFPHFIYIAQEK